MSKKDKKPVVFIGSSREAISYARAISKGLERIAQVTRWYTSFGANEYTMDVLENKLDTSDFGVFIFAADDVVLHRGKYFFITRDNTIFELGLFWGKLKRDRVFAIIPSKVEERDDLIDGQQISDLHLLSDLEGLNILTYHQAQDQDYDGAIDSAFGEIEKAIKAKGFFRDPKAEIEIKQSILSFFYEYNSNVTVNQEEKYEALSEAVRNSFLAPSGFRITGSALWKANVGEGIGHVSGNVGKGNFYKFEDNPEGNNGKQIFVIETWRTKQWQFYERTNDVVVEYVLCYPLVEDHVVSVHIRGNESIGDHLLEQIVTDNEDLLRTINQFVGGDLK